MVGHSEVGCCLLLRMDWSIRKIKAMWLSMSQDLAQSHMSFVSKFYYAGHEEVSRGIQTSHMSSVAMAGSQSFESNIKICFGLSLMGLHFVSSFLGIPVGPADFSWVPWNKNNLQTLFLCRALLPWILLGTTHVAGLYLFIRCLHGWAGIHVYCHQSDLV